MAPSPSTRTKVFISYSHADKEWLDRLRRHLEPLVRGVDLDCWDDTHIRPGDDWKQEIQNALGTAQVAVLLISADFFASDFIDETELPPLLDAAKAKGVRILPVILSASRFARNPALARFQAVNPPDRPLKDMPEGEQERVRKAAPASAGFGPDRVGRVPFAIMAESSVRTSSTKASTSEKASQDAGEVCAGRMAVPICNWLRGC